MQPGQKVLLIPDIDSGAAIEARLDSLAPATGALFSLLPPENATGNFVKVVQRLPVRVDILNYDPDKVPLFVGLSVTPNVHVRETPTGPNAGQYLQGALALPSLGKSETPVK